MNLGKRSFGNIRAADLFQTWRKLEKRQRDEMLRIDLLIGVKYVRYIRNSILKMKNYRWTLYDLGFSYEDAHEFNYTEVHANDPDGSVCLYVEELILDWDVTFQDRMDNIGQCDRSYLPDFLQESAVSQWIQLYFLEKLVIFYEIPRQPPVEVLVEYVNHGGREQTEKQVKKRVKNRRRRKKRKNRLRQHADRENLSEKDDPPEETTTETVAENIEEYLPTNDVRVTNDVRITKTDETDEESSTWVPVEKKKKKKRKKTKTETKRNNAITILRRPPAEIYRPPQVRKRKKDEGEGEGKKEVKEAEEEVKGEAVVVKDSGKGKKRKAAQHPEGKKKRKKKNRKKWKSPPVKDMHFRLTRRRQPPRKTVLFPWEEETSEVLDDEQRKWLLDWASQFCRTECEVAFRNLLLPDFLRAN